MYDVNSKHAEDFINHEEILSTLAYADENKNNLPLIESLIEKAAKRKGLSHREASVLLACEDPDLNEKIFRLAEQIKKAVSYTHLMDTIHTTTAAIPIPSTTSSNPLK